MMMASQMLRVQISNINNSFMLPASTLSFSLVRTPISSYHTFLYFWAHFCLVLFYVLMYSVSMGSNERIVLIENITESKFQYLIMEHSETLACPCSNTALTYKKFVSNTIYMSAICSSVFVNLSWIRALHIPITGVYLPIDFRASAEAQVS